MRLFGMEHVGFTVPNLDEAVRFFEKAFGAVTVSGLAQREDHELIVEALCALLDHDYAELALPREDPE